jgi:hypothetical protein
MKVEDVVLVSLEIETIELSLHTESLGLGSGEGIHRDLFEHCGAVPFNVGQL